MQVKPDNCVISITNLVKSYRDGDEVVNVLKGVNFNLGAGEKVAILGRSGSGKTTLLNCMGGLDDITSGRITLAQRPLSELNEKERGHVRNHFLGLIFQFHHLLPEFSALENVAMPLLIRGMDVKLAKALATDYLNRVNMGHRLSHKPALLSGGERQRVAIARAFVTKPKCILADEPTGNLDSDNAQVIYEMMLELSKEEGTSFIVVTHDTQLASKMDRTLHLKDGLLL